MRNLRERKPGSFEYAFYDKRKNPKRKYITFKADSFEDALIHVAQLLKDYKLGTFDPWLKIVDDIEQAMWRYLNESTHLRKSTREMKRSQLNQFLKLTPHRSFKLIDPATISAFVTAVNTEASRAYRLGIISNFWEWCIHKGYTKTNPVAEFKFDSKIRLSRTKRTKNPLSFKQYFQILAEARNHERAYHAQAIELAAMTGLRRAEVLAIRQQDIRLNGITGSIMVQDWVNPKTGERFTPKNGNRLVPLVPRAALLVKDLLDKITTDDPDARLITYKGDPVKVASVSQKFAAFRDACGIGKSISLHSTRHSYTSWIMALRVSPYDVMRFVGHSSLLVQQRYVHFIDQMLSEGAAKVKREIISIFCPGVDQNILETLFPDSTSFYGSSGAANSLDILDILYGGALYDEALISHLKQSIAKGRMNQN